MIETIAWGILVLGVLVFVHELGHFLAAKMSGIKVHEFSIGFWPRVVGIKKGGTDYRVSALPIGGYVKMAGMSYEDEDRLGAPDEFLSKPWHVRAFVALAGPGMNFVLAVVLCCIMGFVGYNRSDYPPVVGRVDEGSKAEELGLARGDVILSVEGAPVSTWLGFLEKVSEYDEEMDISLSLSRDGEGKTLELRAEELREMIRETAPLNPPVIGSVIIGLPAYSAGLTEGDSIAAINGKDIRDWDDLFAAVSANPDKPISMRIFRDGGAFTVEVTPTRPDADPESPGQIGIIAPRADKYTIKLSVLESIKHGPRESLYLVTQIYTGLGTMVKMAVSNLGSVKNAVVGPIGIVQMVGSQAKSGAGNQIHFVALVSVALMIFNLLPIPVLDGGHILISAAEGLARRRLRPKIHIYVHRAGMALLGALVILVLFNDVRRVVSRGFALHRTDSEAVESGEEPAREAR